MYINVCIYIYIYIHIYIEYVEWAKIVIKKKKNNESNKEAGKKVPWKPCACGTRTCPRTPRCACALPPCSRPPWYRQHRVRIVSILSALSAYCQHRVSIVSILSVSCQHLVSIVSILSASCQHCQHLVTEPELALGRRVALVRFRHILVHLFQGYRVYRGTSLIRNITPLGPYSRTMPRALWWS